MARLKKKTYRDNVKVRPKDLTDAINTSVNELKRFLRARVTSN